jgi:hypothetical protein
MSLSKADLAASLQNEIRILVHLCSKVDPSQADYRPNPKQRSNIELLRYLTVMGPLLTSSIKAGKLDSEGFGARMAAANQFDLPTAVNSLASQSDFYAKAIPEFSDAELAEEIDLFGVGPRSRARWLLDFVLCGHAAYRTQLFMNLKGGCGREELNTSNLWMAMDPASKA